MSNATSPSNIPRLPIHVVLDNIRSAFNVGSIFRTADAGRIEHLHLCGMTPHPPHPRLGRTALGATDHVPWTSHAATHAAIDRLEALGIAPVAIETAGAAENLFEIEWPRPLGLVLGHEVRGLAPDILARCPRCVYIPMFGHKRSLNVATAFGIVLYDVLRDWQPGPPARKSQIFL